MRLPRFGEIHVDENKRGDIILKMDCPGYGTGQAACLITADKVSAISVETAFDSIYLLLDYDEKHPPLDK